MNQPRRFSKQQVQEWARLRNEGHSWITIGRQEGLRNTVVAGAVHRAIRRGEIPYALLDWYRDFQDYRPSKYKAARSGHLGLGKQKDLF